MKNFEISIENFPMIHCFQEESSLEDEEQKNTSKASDNKSSQLIQSFEDITNESKENSEQSIVLEKADSNNESFLKQIENLEPKDIQNLLQEIAQLKQMINIMNQNVESNLNFQKQIQITQLREPQQVNVQLDKVSDQITSRTESNNYLPKQNYSINKKSNLVPNPNNLTQKYQNNIRNFSIQGKALQKANYNKYLNVKIDNQMNQLQEKKIPLTFALQKHSELSSPRSTIVVDKLVQENAKKYQIKMEEKLNYGQNLRKEEKFVPFQFLSGSMIQRQISCNHLAKKLVENQINKIKQENNE